MIVLGDVTHAGPRDANSDRCATHHVSGAPCGPHALPGSSPTQGRRRGECTHTHVHIDTHREREYVCVRERSLQGRGRGEGNRLADTHTHTHTQTYTRTCNTRHAVLRAYSVRMLQLVCVCVVCVCGWVCVTVQMEETWVDPYTDTSYEVQRRKVADKEARDAERARAAQEKEEK